MNAHTRFALVRLKLLGVILLLLIALLVVAMLPSKTGKAGVVGRAARLADPVERAAACNQPPPQVPVWSPGDGFVAIIN